ncbi:MAG: Lipopolysaccharide core heptosyltransferase RfaQ, partial [Chlamydiota bacterium]
EVLGPIYLTGYGDREMAVTKHVAEHTRAINLCNQLSWQEFGATLQRARLVISVDSAAVHLAAATQTPLIILFAGINCPTMWAPPYSLCRTIMAKVPCAPCLQKTGCPSMACIRDISVNQVYQTAVDLIGLEAICQKTH